MGKTTHIICVLLGVVVGFGVAILRNKLSGRDSSTTVNSEGEDVNLSRPCVATLMSDDRSMADVRYRMNSDVAMAIDGQYDVFEAMIFDPNVKSPDLGFWTDSSDLTYDGIPYFTVNLGTDLLPRSLAQTPIDRGHVMVVRYLARMRMSSEGAFYLEEQALLGYAIIDIQKARALAETPNGSDLSHSSLDANDSPPRKPSPLQ